MSWRRCSIPSYFNNSLLLEILTWQSKRDLSPDLDYQCFPNQQGFKDAGAPSPNWSRHATQRQMDVLLSYAITIGCTSILFSKALFRTLPVNRNGGFWSKPSHTAKATWPGFRYIQCNGATHQCSVIFTLFVPNFVWKTPNPLSW